MLLTYEPFSVVAKELHTINKIIVGQQSSISPVCAHQWRYGDFIDSVQLFCNNGRTERRRWTHPHAAHCNTLQHPAPHCDTLRHTATHCNTLQHTVTRCNTLQHTATLCNTLQHTATHCNTLQHTVTHCNTLQYTATHCNTLQHTATHCNNKRTE